MSPGLSENKPIVIEDWSSNWQDEFAAIATRLRDTFGPQALRIDHIGSTSVEGLSAKPIIDIQISVTNLDAPEHFTAMVEAGFLWRKDNPERTKRYFRELQGERRVHLHMRLLGHWHEQWSLLFRDYLRTHPDACRAYEGLKRNLAGRYRDDRIAYVSGKDDFFWETIRRADSWAAETGWQAGPSDA